MYSTVRAEPIVCSYANAQLICDSSFQTNPGSRSGAYCALLGMLVRLQMQCARALDTRVRAIVRTIELWIERTRTHDDHRRYARPPLEFALEISEGSKGRVIYISQHVSASPITQKAKICTKTNPRHQAAAFPP